MTITVQEAAKRLGVSNDAIKRRIYKGEIVAEKNGKSWVIDPESLLENIWGKNNNASTVRASVRDIPISTLDLKKLTGSEIIQLGEPITTSIEGVKFKDLLTPATSITNWKNFIGTLQDGVKIFDNGFKADELIVLSDGTLNLPACFNSKGRGGVFELPPYTSSNFKYADFKPIAWAKWLDVPKGIK